MMGKQLSDEQKSRLASYRQRWLQAQCAVTPADRPAAEAGMRRAYLAAGLAPPRRFEWCAGPRELAGRWRQEAYAKGGNGASAANGGLGRNLRGELFDNPFSRTVAAVERACGRAMRQAVAEGMRLGRPSVLGSAVMAATLQGIEEPAARPLLRFRFWGSRRNYPGLAQLTFRQSGYSAHELGWLGSYQFLHDECELSEATAGLAGQWQAAAHFGWIVPHEHVCYLSERHHVLTSDATERLHCADGPALAYHDGMAASFWKGVAVPANLIEHPDRITARAIDRELDPVVRRCMIDIITPARYIATGSAVRVGEDETGVLWRKLWWGFDAWAAVEVENGTPESDGTRKHYFLQVPPTVRTAREAVAWTYGLSEHQYAQLKLRT